MTGCLPVRHAHDMAAVARSSDRQVPCLIALPVSHRQWQGWLSLIGSKTPAWGLLLCGQRASASGPAGVARNLCSGRGSVLSELLFSSQITVVESPAVVGAAERHRSMAMAGSHCNESCHPFKIYRQQLGLLVGLGTVGKKQCIQGSVVLLVPTCPLQDGPGGWRPGYRFFLLTPRLFPPLLVPSFSLGLR
jgi:hypothetical protein